MEKNYIKGSMLKNILIKLVFCFLLLISLNLFAANKTEFQGAWLKKINNINVISLQGSGLSLNDCKILNGMETLLALADNKKNKLAAYCCCNGRITVFGFKEIINAPITVNALKNTKIK